MNGSELRQHLQDLQNAINGLTQRIDAIEGKHKAPPKPDNPLRLPWMIEDSGIVRDCNGTIIQMGLEQKRVIVAAVNRWEDAKMVAGLGVDVFKGDTIATRACLRILAEKDTQ